MLYVESTGLRSPSLGGHPGDRSRARRALAAWWRGLRPVSPDLYVLSPPALPAGWSGSFATLSARWTARAVARAMANLGFRDATLWAFLPFHADVAAGLPHARLVYHCVDEYAANPGVDRARVEAAEEKLLDAADWVFAASPVLEARLSRRRPDVRLLSNVADTALFAGALQRELPPPDLADLPAPRFVYAGNLAAYRIDFGWLRDLARARPDAALVLIGVVGHGDPAGAPAGWRELCAEPNVHFLGSRPQRRLPEYFAASDVALIPFLDNEHTRASLPLKLWEYLAAGLPVVARRLPNLEKAAADGLLRLADTADEFVAAVGEAEAEPPARRKLRSEQARGHDWEARMDEIEALLAVEAAR